MTRNLQYLTAFFLVFCYQIGQVFISNFLFLINFFFQISFEKKIQFNSTFITRKILIIFLVYVTINTFFYSILIKAIDFRGFVQFLYNFQYFFLIVFVKLNYSFIEKIIFRCSILLSHIMLFHFLISGDSIELFKWNEIAINYYPGWSNTLPLYLIFALFLNRNLKYSIYFSFIIFFAILLTDSRGALLGSICILFLPLVRKFKKHTNFLLTLIIISVIVLLYVIINLETELKFFRAFDRIDIFYTSISYIKQSVFFGFGGNTIEQLSYVVIDHDPLQDWGHTHNFLLEFTLRYGIIGLLLFLLFLFFKLKEIKSFDHKYFFFIFIVLATFQTFMRDFTFLSILIFICHYQHEDNYFLKSNINLK